jgi:hypothetical protein
MSIKKSQDIDRMSKDEQYQTSNEGERDYSANDKGGEDGKNLSNAMNRKYPSKEYRGKEYR